MNHHLRSHTHHARAHFKNDVLARAPFPTPAPIDRRAINLNIDLPIIGPLLSVLGLNGEKSTSTPPKATPTPTPAPAPVTTPAPAPTSGNTAGNTGNTGNAGNTGSSGGSADSGSGSSGGSTGTNNGGGNASSGTGASGDGTGNGNSNGSSGGNSANNSGGNSGTGDSGSGSSNSGSTSDGSSSGGNNVNSDGSSTSLSGNGSSSSDSGASGNNSGSTSNAASGSTNNLAGGDSQSDSSKSGSQVGGSQSSGSSSSGDGADDSNSGSASGGNNAGVAAAVTGSPTNGAALPGITSSGGSASGDRGQTNDGSVTTSGAGANTNNGGLSKGGIAAIATIGSLLLLLLLLLLLRRRYMKKRSQRHAFWGAAWARRGSGSESLQRSELTMIESGGGYLSARSSFANTDLESNGSPPSSYPATPPPLLLSMDSPSISPPPMAQIRDGTESTQGSPVLMSFDSPPMAARSLSPEFDVRVVQPEDNEDDELQSICVRPFTPSESFTFPKPPSRPSTANSADLSRRNTLTQQFLPVGSRPATADNVLGRRPTLARKVSTQARPQTADVNVSRATFSRSMSIMSRSSSRRFRPPSATAMPNPFLTQSEMDVCSVRSVDLEVIQRPFNPTLDDELPVLPGDKVRVVQEFDDGWAFVEKRFSVDGQWQSGLIPVVCLHAGMDSQETLNAQRMSAYGSTYGVAL
ncbi:hypothetical protein PC9H_011001 [Pleurotus ostreatus]|uniref:SH3 domain-containing protein n=2 Tax=Pleurotus TaxID=5320 RepID=A0A8H6ZSP9_PLEOS|nr:uncharacterized protein PC9H_011001 [Pleurotus ostreatus]KAF7422842.1 hypothetical protein PC9H_011001 [Pleurotus ostreatus]KAG9227311.1 hypothetical protein CCMSSC00406_0004150 [Pleurotus cornucopiae]KAJ8691206.1 hypothetical protein PTI98_010803 [Pleurotus ostreatus]